MWKSILALAIMGLAAAGCAPVAGYMQTQQAALTRALMGSGVSVGNRGDDILLQMPDVTFDTGRATIKAEYRSILDDMALILNEYGDTSITVVGHADSTGDAAANQRLSEGRARAVSAYLQRQSVSEDRLTSSGAGESQPVASNETPEGRQQNRRVEIIVRRR